MNFIFPAGADRRGSLDPSKAALFQRTEMQICNLFNCDFMNELCNGYAFQADTSPTRESLDIPLRE